MTARPRMKVERRRPVDDEFEVVTLVGKTEGYRRKPCGPCPWLVENTGDFPPRAFEHSAETSEDGADRTFACHETGHHGLVCAGFLLNGSDHNFAVRIAVSTGKIDLDKVHADERELYPSYRAMAIGNGVAPDSPALANVRDPGYQ